MRHGIWALVAVAGALGLGVSVWRSGPAPGGAAASSVAAPPPRGGEPASLAGPEPLAAEPLTAEPLVEQAELVAPVAAGDATTSAATRRDPRARERADELRRRARREPVEPARPAAAPSPAAAPIARGPRLTPDEQERRATYLRRAVREQYFPVARACYQELLERQPTAAGKVVLGFSIVGAGDAGVVDQVELGDGTTLEDAEFTLCMRESLYTAVFEPPPPGARETTVVYPIELRPGP